MDFSRDFSKKTVSQLNKKGISVIGKQAVPAFEGDLYFSGTAYVLDAAGTQIIRTYSQIVVMGSSSWTPTCLTVEYENAYN